MWDWRDSCQLAHVANPAGVVFGFATNEFKSSYKQRQGQRSFPAPRDTLRVDTLPSATSPAVMGCPVSEARVMGTTQPRLQTRVMGTTQARVQTRVLGGTVLLALNARVLSGGV